MKITVAGIRFDHHHYDPRGDVLYLNVGEPQTAAHGIETPEGHAVHYDENWVVTGVTLLNVRWSLARDGELTLTWPPARVAADRLAAALAP
jgi:uncharacterized protein YuzE